MSQFKITSDSAQKCYPSDAFATITVASTTGFVQGQACWQGTDFATGTATAKVSRVVSATKLLVKGVKGTFANATVVKSSTVPSGSSQSAFAWGMTKSRDVNGVATDVVFGAMSEDDRGIIQEVNARSYKTVVVAARLATSKMQTSDSGSAPSLAYTLPAAKSYADGETLTFRVTSNEALSVAGAPRIAIVTVGSAETVYATYQADKSSSMNLVFEYVNDADVTSAGQIVSVAYNANGATVTDIGGTTVTVSANLGAASVTGIILA